MKNGRRFGSPPKPYTPPDTPEGKINLTDPDSKLVHGMHGWVQGYNAQMVCNEKHVILAAEIMTASPDFGHLGPMFTAAREELASAGVNAAPKVVLADAGYWHLEQMNEITGAGVPVLIPPDSSRRKNKPRRPGWDGEAPGGDPPRGRPNQHNAKSANPLTRRCRADAPRIDDGTKPLPTSEPQVDATASRERSSAAVRGVSDRFARCAR